MTDPEIPEWLADLELRLLQHYDSPVEFQRIVLGTWPWPTDPIPTTRKAYDWRCSYCVETSTECLFGDSGCPYRQPRKEVCAT